MSARSVTALKERCHGMSAGIYAAPLGHLADAARAVSAWGGTLLHFDVMDGIFVPQITAGPAFVEALGIDLVRDVHLMVANPDEHVAAFARAGADIITVHAEAPAAAKAIAAVRAISSQTGRPILAGLAVMPGTPLAELAVLLDLAPDLVLVLALDPRAKAPADFGAATARLRIMREMTAVSRPLMAIDGGVTEETIALAAEAAPEIIVSGSAIFRAADPGTTFRRLNAAAMHKALEAENAQ